jgi:hypothetical protein
MNTLFFSRIARAAAGAAAAVLLCAACTFSADGLPSVGTVEIALPAYPPPGAGRELPPLAGWLVVTQKDGRPLERFVDASARVVALELPKNQIEPVLCYPLVGSEGILFRFFYPAGCVYPCADTAGWKHGFDALLAFGLLTGGAANSGGENVIRARVSAFNWKRLHDEIDMISNPWNMDMTQFKVAIASRSFTKRIIKTQKTVETYVRDAPPRMYAQYVPDAAFSRDGADTYEYCPARENLAFDGTDVFLVQKPAGTGAKGATGMPYTLARMPSSRYIYSR